MNCSNILGNYIKEKRVEEGYSIRKFADLVGISFTELTRIESGERVIPNLLTLIYICKILDIDMDNLLKISGFKDNNKNKLYEIEVKKTSKKKFYVSASNDEEAFDNLSKFIENKKIYNLSEDEDLIYEIINKKSESSLDDEKESIDEIEEEINKSDECIKCKYYCPICEECEYGDV